MTSATTTARVAPTLEMVAAEAGVSRATVSRVVNGSPKVSPEVIENVQAAISRLGYTPNRAARSLANRRSMVIALVVPEDTSRLFGDPYFAAIVKGITDELDASDYVLNLHLARSEAAEKTIAYLTGGNVDGALVVSHHVGDAFLTELGRHLPVVYGGRPIDPEVGDPVFIDIDNVSAAADGTQYLIDAGCSRIASITGPADMPAGIDRLAGFQRAMRAAGLDDSLVADGDFTMTGGARAARTLLDRDASIDGLFVASDLMAVGAVTALRERGLRVPDDVKVMGFDDSPAALTSEVELTTVRQPSEEQGRLLARTLLQLLRGEETTRRTIMPTDIVVRASA
ncbi:LacI family transcriptional regulator [Microcella putealis]|uniref:LacI family transcriptional regulator n=1 Tax=Microcella putealis TaxID=337005 RepID=A0A4Q7LR91_9MICO|nr:LacI family DNA-binding transcriptional regulator [Microcella putealis]RZS56368.1 LacI family transcriptional regulator [Microcella putealis]TQM27146.1 LacI family transcriptional regulator [Microcella putealis]